MLWQNKKNFSASDDTSERQGFGTVGADHITPVSLNGRTLNQVVSPFDPSIIYGGTWTLSVGALLEDFLGRSATSTTPSSSLTLTFNSSSITIIGSNVPGGGYADVYVDGVLKQGKVNTYTFLSAAYALSGLNATDTTINVNDSSAFAATGSIIIDNEVITYTGNTGTSFTGCTRSAGVTHTTGGTVYAYSSLVNFYSAYKQSRVAVWSNTNLGPGQHKIQIVVRSDFDPAGVSPGVYVSAFMLNGVVGASNLNTNFDVYTLTRVFDANGVSTVANSPSPKTTTQQILGVLGCAAYSGSTFKPCFASYNAVNGAFTFYCPTGASSTLTVVVTFIVVGASI